MGSEFQAFRGAIITPRPGSSLTIDLHEEALLVVHNGRIIAFYPTPASVPPSFSPPAPVHVLQPGEFLIPGFVDTHNHAPQWPMRGIGQGLHILDWLDQVTFPFEARFANADYAARSYADTVDDFLRQGITTASYYGSRHMPATKLLAETCLEKGQRALVGKCNMDRNAPDYIVEESAETSLEETKECIQHIRNLPGCADAATALVRPVVTPRFAICCTPELLTGLGDLVKQDDTLYMQTHFNEAQQEVDFTTHLFPQFNGSEADLYEHYNLLNSRSILAHCTVMADYEKKRIGELGCGVAHCPISNMTVGGGFMVAPVREYLDAGINVGLGTDSGGGWASQMLMVIRQAMIAANAQEVFSHGKNKALSIDEVFYLATMGGAKVVGLDKTVGSFEVGKEFDAVWVTTTPSLKTAMTPREDDDSLRRVFEKYVMTGDDRNMPWQPVAPPRRSSPAMYILPAMILSLLFFVIVSKPNLASDALKEIGLPLPFKQGLNITIYRNETFAPVPLPKSHAQTADIEQLIRQVESLSRTTRWTSIANISFEGETFEPEGLVRLGNDRFVVSAGEYIAPRQKDEHGNYTSVGAGFAHLMVFDGKGRRIADASISVPGSTEYHIGGIDYDGTYLWGTIGEYRPDSSSYVFRASPYVLEPEILVHHADHLGAIVHDTVANEVTCLTWGGRKALAFKVNEQTAGAKSKAAAHLVREKNNWSYFVDYQDCKWLGRPAGSDESVMLCSGVARLNDGYVLGGLALVDVETLEPIVEVPITLASSKDTRITMNPMEVALVDGKLRLYWLPDQHDSTLYVYEAA
ncbi:hypothetical protein TD95_002574 [Thielaviopsis punctulata]|uniref:Probable guanine deaminase n=1 Tax=Thielaviopsis punctulata TaxID=72032 RepID=A0A0F4ZEC0_9PEZI|nr:hypothetical protein TD95_002574 [Thielaviopsis punctulata]